MVELIVGILVSSSINIVTIHASNEYYQYTVTIIEIYNNQNKTIKRLEKTKL